MDNPRNALAPGYKLHWYTINKILGQGGFGITYLADDTNLNQSVAIKEFLPIEMAVRDQSSSVHPVSGEYGDQFKWGLDRFMSEAQTLAKFKHPNIVRVFTVFPENNTAYMVMEYEHGKGMHELLKNKNTLSEEKLKAIILPILDGLKQVHAAGFIHRDIKPANIFIREDGSPVLLDFGSARQSFGQQTHTLTTMVSPGFAPFEQYVSKSNKQGPWTDIYGLGATMYRAVIGRSPSEAMDRSEGLLHTESDTLVTASEINPEGYSPSLLSAIDHALAFKPEDRPQSVTDWQSEVLGSAYVDQSEIETVVDPDHLKQKADTANALASEKTEVLKRPDDIHIKKKPSLFRRVGKYALIGFGILFVLAVLDEGNKKQITDTDQAVEADVVDHPPSLTDEIIVDDENFVPDQIKKDTDPEQIDNTHEQIMELLAKAEEDIKAHRLSKPDGNNALDKYQQILALDPGNADVQEGLFNVATEYLKITENNIHNKKLDKAVQHLELAKEISPEHPEIPPIEKVLLEDIKAHEEMLARESRDRDAPQSLITDEDKRQISTLQARIKENPRDRAARKEIQSIMKSYESKVKEAIEAGELDTATAFLREAQSITPRSIRIKTLLKKIEQKRKSPR
jgi:serine/threonine protein kinase